MSLHWLVGQLIQWKGVHVRLVDTKRVHTPSRLEGQGSVMSPLSSHGVVDTRVYYHMGRNEVTIRGDSPDPPSLYIPVFFTMDT